MTSDAPCRAPQRTGIRLAARNQGRFHHHLVNEGGFPGPERLYLDKCPREVRSHGHSDGWEPATGLAALPPTIRLPTLFRLSERSRVERLDPASVPQTLRPRASWATRRLSTSAIDTTYEHNHESP
jgi:hypothetical protein